MRRKNSLSLTVMVIVMALLAIFVGYLIGNWLIQIVMGNPEEKAELTGKKIIQEEIIRDNTDNNSNNSLSNQKLNNENKFNADINQDNLEKSNEKNLEVKEKEFLINNNIGKEVFAVQVGAFNKYDNALSLKNELESRGFQVIITEGIPYKVQLGASTNREEVENIEKEIEALGYNAFITH